VAGVLRLSFLPILLTLFVMSFLDTLGTLVGVGAAGNLLDKEGNLPEMEKPMLVDAVSCMFSGLVGTSTAAPTSSRPPASARGPHRPGGGHHRDPLPGALFFIPLFEPLQSLRYAYAPALIAVGVLMLGQVTKIDFSDLTELVPAFITIVMMVFSYNIANGLTAGLLLHPVVKVAAGRFHELTPGSIVLALMCATYYLFGLPH